MNDRDSSHGTPAARLGDRTEHGGMVFFGDTTVLIGGAFAARTGDVTVCPKHGVGQVVEVSTDILCSGKHLARVTTGCECAKGLLASKIVRTNDAEGRDEKEQRRAKGYSGPTIVTERKDVNRDGILDSFEVKESVGTVQVGDGTVAEVVSHEREEREIIDDRGVELVHTEKLVVARTTTEAQVGDSKITGETNYGVAEGGYKLLAGHSGDRRGFATEGGFEAKGAEATLNFEGKSNFLYTLPPMAAALESMRKDPYVDNLLKPYDFKFRVKPGVSAESVGAYGGLWVVEDLAKCEIAVGAKGDLSLLAGLGLDVEIVTSGADACKAPPQETVKDNVASGCDTVLIGGRK